MRDQRHVTAFGADRRLRGDDFTAAYVSEGSTAGVQGVALVDGNAPHSGPRDLVGWQSEA